MVSMRNWTPEDNFKTLYVNLKPSPLAVYTSSGSYISKHYMLILNKPHNGSGGRLKSYFKTLYVNLKLTKSRAGLSK